MDHNDDANLIVGCSVEISGDKLPIELVGTGYLQLIQIFTYVLLFKPGILLIDEPDIHLHPTVQENLAQVLALVAQQLGVRILLTTHSQFIVRGSPSSTRVYWLKEGVVESDNRSQVELALGWGAFGKKLLIVSEDTDTLFLRKLIAQWPEIEKFIAIYPGSGFKHVPNPQQAVDIREALGNKYKILIHRDRDSLTDLEVAELVQKYSERGVYLWIPDSTDVEGIFCDPAYLSAMCAIDLDEATCYLTQVQQQNAVSIRDKFNSQRTAHNRELYDGGGSPLNEDVWHELQTKPLKGAKGKFVFSQLKNKIPGNRFNKELILSSTVPVPLASSLKDRLEQLLEP